MKQYQATRLRITDREKLINLLKTREEYVANPEGAKVRAELQHWIAFHNPHANDEECTYYVLEEDNKIIAFHGRMPAYFSVNGEKVKGYFVHDLYVDPEIRKKGEGFWITMSLAAAIEKDTSSFFCLLGMTPLNLQMQRRRKYFESKTIGWVKIIRPRRLLSKKLKVKVLVNLLDMAGELTFNFMDLFLNKSPGKGETMEEIERFDERFDIFMEKNLKNAPVASYKDASYLNWKFMERPFAREKAFALIKGHEVLGYIVLGMSPYNQQFKIGVIMDIMAGVGDERTISKLLTKAKKYLSNQGACEIQSLLTNEAYAKVFKRHFFLKKEGKTVMLGNLDQLDKYKEYLKKMSNWHFTMSESDAFMLNT